MARCCPRACGQLAASAAFLSVGIVQIIAGIILLKSKYAFMLSGPDIWTALCNISVGSLLGVTATVWKNINRNSSRHARRRKFLAALVSSGLVLNATTAAMLIVGEDGNNNTLLVIQLESAKDSLANEFRAYAYATSVCSPVVALVISITFLTGICFRKRAKTTKSLDFKSILNADDGQIYSWVYTSKLPKPDPEIMNNALSSDSESSSTESDSDSSSDLPVPLQMRSRSSLLELNKTPLGSMRASINKNSRLDSPISSTRMQTSLRKEIPSMGVPKLSDSVKSVDVYHQRTTPDKWQTQSLCHFRKELQPSIFKKQLSGTKYPPNILNKSVLVPNTGSIIPSPNPKYPLNQMDYSRERSKILEKTDCAMPPNQSGVLTHQMSMNASCALDGSVIAESEVSLNNSQNFHSKIRRTSTTHQSKVNLEPDNLDSSSIHYDTEEMAHREYYPDETLCGMEIYQEGLSSSFSKGYSSNVMEEVLRTRNDSPVFVRNVNFRKKLSSKLVPATIPKISDGFFKTPNRSIMRYNRVTPYSKPQTGYDKYTETGFSSFKERKQVDEVDAMKFSKKHSSIIKKSPMTSISEKPTEEEIVDSFLPSTSAHTSGYMSESYEESEDEAELDTSQSNASRPQPSTVQKLLAEEIRESYRKRSERVTFESDCSR